MGIETFQVTLAGGQSSRDTVDQTLRLLPHVRPDPQSGYCTGATYYVMDDGEQVIEVELTDSPVGISCRFTLCHPDTIDAGFIRFVSHLVIAFGMEVTIREDVRPEHEDPFPPDRLAEFAECLPGYIATRRRVWFSVFGTERIAASSEECFRRIILPRCQPPVDQT